MYYGKTMIDVYERLNITRPSKTLNYREALRLDFLFFLPQGGSIV